MSAQGESHPSCCDIPDPDGPVATGGGQLPSVRTIGHTRKAVGMPREFVSLLRGDRVPELDDTASADRGKPPTIRTEGEPADAVVHASHVTAKRQDFSTRGG